MGVTFANVATQREAIVSGRTKANEGHAAPEWVDRLVEESVERIEEWRELANGSSGRDVSKEEAEKTHAVMLSVLELMQLHRASLREMAQRRTDSEDSDGH